MIIQNVTLTTTATQLGDQETTRDLQLQSKLGNAGTVTVYLHSTPTVIAALGASEYVELPRVSNLNELDVLSDNAGDILIIRS